MYTATFFCYIDSNFGPWNSKKKRFAGESWRKWEVTRKPTWEKFEKKTITLWSIPLQKLHFLSVFVFSEKVFVKFFSGRSKFISSSRIYPGLRMQLSNGRWDLWHSFYISSWKSLKKRFFCEGYFCKNNLFAAKTGKSETLPLKQLEKSLKKKTWFCLVYLCKTWAF